METNSSSEKNKVAICHVCGGTSLRSWGRKHDFNHDICRDCGVIFLNPLPETVEHIYNDSYFVGSEGGYGYSNYDADKEAMREVFVDYLQRLEQLTQGRRIFDVGAATGYFLERARERGWQGGGVEISRFATARAQEKGFDVVHGTLDMIQDSNTYHVVTMWDVLEHVASPHADITKVRDILEPQGIVAINTPDSGSWYARLLGKKWHLIVPPEHIFLHTKKSIRQLLESNGFEIIVYTKIGKKFTLGYITNILHHWLGWKIWKYCLNFLAQHPKIARISLPINLRDNMFVIARKK